MDGPDPRPAPTPPDTSKVALDAREVIPIFGLGRLAPFSIVRTVERNALQPHWKRLGVWLVALTLVLWLITATALFAFVKYHRGFVEVRYTHMLFLPWKIDEYRRSKGEFLIKEGLQKAEAQEWRAAFDLLRSGLHTVPEHREARLLVARIYMMAGRQDATRATLLAGLEHHGDQLDYLREVLGYFFALQADETIVAITSELLPRLEPRSPAARVATTALAYAHFNRSRFTEAVAVLEKANLLATPEGRFVSSRVAWEQGRREEALAGLRTLVARVPDDVEIYRTLVHYLREERRWPELRRASLERQLALPDKPEGHIDHLFACAQLGDSAAVAQGEAAFLARFHDDPAALLKLSELASQLERADLARRVAERCRDLDRNEPEAVFQLLGTLLARRDYPEALGTWADWAVRSRRWTERQRLIFGALKGVALYATGNATEAQPLVRRLSDTRLVPAPTLTAFGLQLERIGQPDEARRVWLHASQLDPLHQPAWVNLLRRDLAESQLENAPELVAQLVTMRRPPRELLAALESALESDLQLFNPRRKATLASLRDQRAQPAAPPTP